MGVYQMAGGGWAKMSQPRKWGAGRPKLGRGRKYGGSRHPIWPAKFGWIKKRTITVCRGAGAKDIISTCESESGNIKIKYMSAWPNIVRILNQSIQVVCLIKFACDHKSNLFNFVVSMHLSNYWMCSSVSQGRICIDSTCLNWVGRFDSTLVECRHVILVNW